MMFREKIDQQEEGVASPEEILLTARLAVEEKLGREIPISHLCPDGAVLLSEAVNSLAKEDDDYSLKAPTWASAASLPGVKSGWGDDGCFYLSGPNSGPVSAHDPYGELATWLSELAPQQAEAIWPDPWDGKKRQPWAIQRLLGLPKTHRRAQKKTSGAEGKKDAVLPHQ